MNRSAQDIAYSSGANYRETNRPRSECSDVADIVYDNDYSLRLIMLEGYDDKDADLAAEMS